ncbi:MAG: hypothetical protein JXA90_00825, partial [Planctomycetes bacterium]|nr:hypothetical protein [Planctomycetota bacterium]
MKVLEVRNINIEPSSIREALADLEAAIAKSTQMKELLEQLLALSTGDGAKARSRRRGRPKGKRSKAQEKTAAKGSGRKAARGMTLRQAIVKVLKSAGKPLRPIDLCRKVLDAGYKSKATAESFYTAVFSTAKKEPMVQKLDKAFALKKGAAVAA